MTFKDIVPPDRWPAASYLYILYRVLNPCRLLSTKSVYSCERWKGPLSDRSQSKGLVACWSDTAATAKTQHCRLRATHSHSAIRENASAAALLHHVMLPPWGESPHSLSLPQHLDKTHRQPVSPPVCAPRSGGQDAPPFQLSMSWLCLPRQQEPLCSKLSLFHTRCLCEFTEK